MRCPCHARPSSREEHPALLVVCHDAHHTGPLHYTIGPPESVSPVARAPAYSFSRTTRGMTKGSVFSAQLDADHTCGTAADTPGHIYDPYRPGKDSGVASLRFGTSAQRYSPERGRNLGGPVVSK